jgi:hypothetical protein
MANVKIGQLQERKDGVLTIKLEDNVTINVNGKKVTSGYFNLQCPIEELEWKASQGYEGAAEKLEKNGPRYAEKGDLNWIKYFVKVQV